MNRREFFKAAIGAVAVLRYGWPPKQIALTSEWSACFDTASELIPVPTKYYADCMRVSGLGLFTLKPEGTPIQFD